MSATPVNKEAVRIMVRDFGYNETAKRLNIKAPTLRKWAERGNWNVQPRTDERVTLVTKPVADAHAEALAEMESATRISLARSVKRLSKDSETVTLRDSKHVKNVAQTAAIVHKWDAKSTQTNVMVNIALLGVDPSEVSAQTIDVDSGVSDSGRSIKTILGAS